MARPAADKSQPPLILIIPGLNNSGPDHWQTHWEQQREDCRRVDLGTWDRPHRNTWVNKLNLAIALAGRPVVLVGHSLGCLAVAWWAKLERPQADRNVLGALLVAPPEVDFFPRDDRLSGFAPTPQGPLPFPSILVASRNDPYMGIRTARRLAKSWDSSFVDAGAIGHINADSGVGDWPFGQYLLDRILNLRNPEKQRDASAARSIGRPSSAARFSPVEPGVHSEPQ